MRGTLIALVVATSAGCRYDPVFGACAVACTGDTSCPTDYTCGDDHFCHRNAAPPSEMCLGDGGTPTDSSRPDGVLVDDGPPMPDGPADAAPPWIGTYIITWTDIGGSCSGVTPDRLDVALDDVTYRSEACPAAPDVIAPATGSTSTTLTIGAGITLRNCKGNIVEDLASHTLTFAGITFDAVVNTEQRIPPQSNIVCTGQFALHGIRE